MSRASPRFTRSEQAGTPPRRGAPEKFDLLQVVYVRDAHPELGLTKGECGTVVEVFERPHRAYYVEFVTDDGATKAEGAFTPDQLSATPPPP